MPASSNARLSSPCRADKRAALQIFFVSRLLSYEYDRCCGQTFAEYRLRGVTVKFAALADLRRVLQLGKIRSLGNPRRRPGSLRDNRHDRSVTSRTAGSAPSSRRQEYAYAPRGDSVPHD